MAVPDGERSVKGVPGLPGDLQRSSGRSDKVGPIVSMRTSGGTSGL